MNMTELENKVYGFIEKNSDAECMECVDIKDLIKGVGENAKVLRGVISSLVKKDMIEVEEFDNGFDRIEYYYWLKDAFEDI